MIETDILHNVNMLRCSHFKSNIIYKHSCHNVIKSLGIYT